MIRQCMAKVLVDRLASFSVRLHSLQSVVGCVLGAYLDGGMVTLHVSMLTP
jgi:hypothetical protein